MALRRRFAKGAVILLTLAMLVVVLFPFYWTITSSFKEYVEMFSSPPTLIPKTFTGENYSKVMQGTFPKALTNSLFIAAVSTTIALALGVPAAYAFSRYSLDARRPCSLSSWPSACFPLFRSWFPCT